MTHILIEGRHNYLAKLRSKNSKIICTSLIHVVAHQMKGIYNQTTYVKNKVKKILHLSDVQDEKLYIKQRKFTLDAWLGFQFSTV